MNACMAAMIKFRSSSGRPRYSHTNSHSCGQDVDGRAAFESVPTCTVVQGGFAAGLAGGSARRSRPRALQVFDDASRRPGWRRRRDAAGWNGPACPVTTVRNTLMDLCARTICMVVGSPMMAKSGFAKWARASSTMRSMPRLADFLVVGQRQVQRLVHGRHVQRRQARQECRGRSPSCRRCRGRRAGRRAR